MQKNRVFGGSFTESLASYDHESSSWKTCQMCFDWGDSTYSEVLPKSGTMQNGQLYQLDNLEHPTYENDGFVLPTPTSNSSLHCNLESAQKEAKRLHPQGRWTLWTKIAEMGTLPTPMAHDAKNNPFTPSRHTGKHENCLNTIIGKMYMLPTPSVNGCSNNPTNQSQWKRKSSLPVEAAKITGHTKETIGKKTRLNPHFVQWMMGFPEGWLD